MEVITESQFSTTTIRILPLKEPEPVRLQFALEIDPDHPHYREFTAWRNVNIASALLALVRVAGPGPFLLLPALDPPQLYRLAGCSKTTQRLAEAFEAMLRYGEPSEQAVRLVEKLAEFIDDEAHMRRLEAQQRRRDLLQMVEDL